MRLNSKFYPLALVIALTSCAMLMQQILLTRLFSAQLFYHFAFAVVSLTMLGLTYGAINVYLNYRHLKQNELAPYISKHLTLYFVYSCIFALLIFIRSYLPGLGESSLSLLVIILTTFTAVLCFTQSGSIIGILLTRYASFTPRLYAADLCGAGLGCWLTLVALSSMGFINTLILTTVLIAMAGLCHATVNSLKTMIKSPEFGRLAATLLVLIVCIIANAFSPNFFYVDKNNLTEYEGWNSHSRIIVSVLNNSFPPDFTLSEKNKNHQGNFPHKQLVIDSTASTILTAFDGSFKNLSYLKTDLTASPYYLRKVDNVAIIGVGGGRDILIALTNGAKHVLGIEVNNTIFALFTTKYANFIGNLAQRPDVDVVNDEARGYLARLKEPVDLIQVSLVDTWAATASGAFGLTENGLYTSEAWEIFYNRLTDQGILSFTRWYRPGVHEGELYRMLSMAHELLNNHGVSDTAAHIAIVFHGEKGVTTLLISKPAITKNEADALQNFAARSGFTALLPGKERAEGDIAELISRGELQNSKIKLDLSPPTDNRPFFFNMIRPYEAFSQKIIKKSDGHNETNNSINNSAVQLLLVLAVILSIASSLILFKPLLNSRSALKGQKIGTPFIYFSMLGFGFMLVEVPLIQYLSLYLGRPSLALTVALFGLLTFSGVGSYFSQHKFLPARVKLLLLTLAVLSASLLLPVLLAHTYTFTETTRIGFSLIFTLLTGFWMGMAFPLGLAAAKSNRNSEILPWLWAINGATSVIGAVLALIIAIFYGISQAMLAGAICYAIAFIAYGRLSYKR